MLAKNQDLLMLNLSGIMTERVYLTEKKLKAKNIAIAKSLAATLIEMLNKARESTILKMFGHLIGKFHLRMKQEIQLYFMINPDLVSNGQGKKKNALWKKKDGLFFVYF